MAFLNSQRAKLAAMQQAASEQEAIQATVLGIHARMQELDDLANGGPKIEDTPAEAVQVEDLTPEEWRQRLAALSAPVTAAPAAPPAPPPSRRPAAHLLESAGGASGNSDTAAGRLPSSRRSAANFMESAGGTSAGGVPSSSSSFRATEILNESPIPISSHDSHDLTPTRARSAMIVPNQVPSRPGTLFQMPAPRSPGKMSLPMASAFASSGPVRLAESSAAVENPPSRSSSHLYANPMPGRPGSLLMAGASVGATGVKQGSDGRLHSALIRDTAAESAKAESALKQTVCMACFDIPC